MQPRFSILYLMELIILRHPGPRRLRVSQIVPPSSPIVAGFTRSGCSAVSADKCLCAGQWGSSGGLPLRPPGVPGPCAATAGTACRLGILVVFRRQRCRLELRRTVQASSSGECCWFIYFGQNQYKEYYGRC